MRFNASFFAVGLAALGLALTPARDASACGGAFSETSNPTVVTGHRMILSVSQQQTTLWDQIKYNGAPSSFAWVLPIKGTVDIGLSSDALFDELDQLTAVQVQSPPLPQCGDCNSSGAEGSGGGLAGGSSGGGVTVIASQVVGPYETVQLSATDPMALETWLTAHGYALPADIAPVVAAYVNEGFNFLAMKLIPGMGISAMKPVRVTTPGASPVLPLRMVAAGTGAHTTITLWVLGEGRYETTSQPAFQVDQTALVWDWDTMTSNYTAVTTQEFTAKNNAAWLVEAGEPIDDLSIRMPLINLAMTDPTDSGYTGDGGSGGSGGGGSGGAGGSGGGTLSASEAAQADLDTLFTGIDTTSLWISRLRGELGRPALAADLQIGAAKDQSIVMRDFQLTNTTGTAPTCPPNSCGDTVGSGAGGAGGAFTAGTGGSPARGAIPPQTSSGCAVVQSDRDRELPAWILGFAGAFALAALRRKRSR